MAPPMKRRKLADKPVDELTFDMASRQDYLTGFHKRKQARIQHARDAAVKREKEEKTVERRQLRERRKEELQQHVEAINAELKKQNALLAGADSDEAGELAGDSEDDADSEDDSKPAEAPEDLEETAEYVDEDKFTTVTVEPMGDSEEDEAGVVAAEQKAAQHARETAEAEKAAKAKKRPWADKPKVKKKKFRYESKAERAVTRQKQKSKNQIAKARRKGE